MKKTIIWQRLQVEHYENMLKNLIKEHIKETHSPFAEQLLQDWDMEKGKFWQVVPKEMLDKLDIPVTNEENLQKTAKSDY